MRPAAPAMARPSTLQTSCGKELNGALQEKPTKESNLEKRETPTTLYILQITPRRRQREEQRKIKAYKSEDIISMEWAVSIMDVHQSISTQH